MKKNVFKNEHWHFAFKDLLLPLSEQAYFTFLDLDPPLV